MRMMIALLVFASVSMADTITYRLTIDWTTGGLVGTQSFGEFSWDDAGLSGVGNERVRVVGNSLTLDLTVDGIVLDETDDLSYPVFPIVFLEEGVLLGLNFLWAPNGFLMAPEVFITSTASYVDANGAFSEGSISYSPVPVPEPGTVVLFGAAALGAYVLSRRRKAS